MKLLKNISRLALFLSLMFVLNTGIRAGDGWIRVHSKNFNLIGNAAESEIKNVALKLEEFRAALSQVLDQYNFNSPVPTTVLVFKSAADYKPFKPLKKNGETDDFVTGHFLAGRDVNYISLSVEGDPARLYQIIFHEYTHFLLRNNLGESNIPPWFNEGLAVYYETFSYDDEQKIKLGEAPQELFALLKRNELIPLETFFNFDNLALHEQSEEGVGLFYAQSWALMHYFIHSGNGARKPQLDAFLKLVMAGNNPKTAFLQAFQTDFVTIESELRKYIQKKSVPFSSVALKEKIQTDAEMRAAVLSETETQSILGDFLLHSGRLAEAEARLTQSLNLNPNNLQARTSLGLLRLSQKNYTEAEKYLENAVKSDSANYLTNYYYAYALSRVGMTDFGFIIRYDSEEADKMRSALRKAIELNPDYAESYDLYAFVNIIRNENLTEAIEYLNKSLAIAPGNQWFAIHLAEAYLGQQNFARAREIAAKINSTAGDKEIKVYAQSALRRIISTEAAYEEIKNYKNNPQKNPLDRELTDEELAKLRALQINESLNESLYIPKEKEKRFIGNLTRIECEQQEIIFTVKSNGEFVKLKSASFDSIRFVAFSSEMAFSQIGCGEQKKQSRAVINYRPSANANEKTSGEIISVEFVPENFKLLNYNK